MYVTYMGRSDLPDTYVCTHGLEGKCRLHMLHMLCNTFITMVTIVVAGTDPGKVDGVASHPP